jgi:xylan 1,4-beta-xylosidase
MAGAEGTYLADYLQHTLQRPPDAAGNAGRAGKPLDFVAFHAKGAPTLVDGHVRMGIAEQLRTMDRGFGIVASIPETKALPIIIGESDPDGCAACRGPQYGYRNGTMYASYTAATLAHAYDLAARHGVRLEGALTWAFEFEDQPYFPGFRVLASNGIDHPVLNVFRLLSRLPGRRLGVESSGALPLDSILARGVRVAPDISALAARDSNRVAVLVWHYHDDDVAGPDADLDLVVRGLPAGVGEVTITQDRIDATHGNAYAAWLRMGSPIAPSDE